MLLNQLEKKLQKNLRIISDFDLNVFKCVFKLKIDTLKSVYNRLYINVYWIYKFLS